MGQSLSSSITATISKRMGRATQCMYEIQAIVEDCRAQITSGLMTGIRIREAAVIPFVLYNFGTGFDIKKKYVE